MRASSRQGGASTDEPRAVARGASQGLGASIAVPAPADYSLPRFQGRKLLPPGEEHGAEFQKTRKDAQKLLALKPAEQEAALVNAVINNDLFGERNLGDEELSGTVHAVVGARTAYRSHTATAVFRCRGCFAIACLLVRCVDCGGS